MRWNRRLILSSLVEIVESIRGHSLSKYYVVRSCTSSSYVASADVEDASVCFRSTRKEIPETSEYQPPRATASAAAYLASYSFCCNQASQRKFYYIMNTKFGM